MTTDPVHDDLLRVADLEVRYRTGYRRFLSAVDGVSLAIRPGETVGLVGESGSGKTTLGRALVGLAKVSGGDMTFEGRDITHLSRAARRPLSARLQMVFQDPYSSLSPVRTVGQTLMESLRNDRRLTAREKSDRVAETLKRVRLDTDTIDRYPHEFSGGQRQRIAIARAIIGSPRLVICDEPVSALDLSIQAQVLNLLKDIQAEFGVGYLFIGHDLPVMRYMSDRLLVMFKGKVVEEGDSDDLVARPRHPYTRALLAAAPVPDPDLQHARSDRRRRTETRAAADDPGVGVGCAYAPRCALATELCRAESPRLERTPDGTSVACHRWREVR
jgi:oligopeptide/dipeptide ABC transporter ATP-binding protein